MPRRRLAALVAASLLCAPAGAQEPPMPATTPDDRLLALLEEDHDALMARYPTWASVRGDRRFDDRLTDPSPEAEAAWLAACAARLEAARAVDLEALAPANRVSAELLLHELERRLAAGRFREWLTPLTQVNGPQQSLPQLPERLSFTTRADREAWAARLEAIPGHLAQVVANMRRGLEDGVTPPRLVLARAAEQCRAQATGASEDHALFAPFRGLGADDALRARAARATAAAMEAFGRLAAFVDDEYVPACREALAATSRPDGEDYYAYCLQEHSTLPLAAEEIHAIGLREVARIKAEMHEVIGRAGVELPPGLEGDARLRAFVERLRADPRSYCRTADELLARYRDVAKRVDPELPRLFGRLPRNTYGVRAMPDFIAPSAPTAYYYSGSLDNGTPGWFVANTHRLDQRPTYEMVPLTLHEAVPGHHLQIALAQEMTDLPRWRTLLGYTAYVEGWALYAERLGLEMGPPGSRGLYADPIDDFGRLSYEMWRALRLVVDTGLHALGWTRQRAVDYMLANSALTPENVEREVDRYVAWPGQAVAYKLGELTIRDLRRRAEERLGDRFDLRAFHDVVLGEGAVPLGVLERMVERWIDGQ
ncbi:MAG: DUF885 domain-containing protein [Planctomycetes bacterium]|nr:DUF885 domain-containing protein [Planctomycetota bacterium]